MLSVNVNSIVNSEEIITYKLEAQVTMKAPCVTVINIIHFFKCEKVFGFHRSLSPSNSTIIYFSVGGVSDEFVVSVVEELGVDRSSFEFFKLVEDMTCHYVRTSSSATVLLYSTLKSFPFIGSSGF